MSELDPDDTPPAGAQDTQSSDQSKSKLRAAWDAWTSRPENNAALIQTGIAMLQPRAPGQSGIGAFANAIGEGAAASDRNVATQRAEADAAANREFKSREAGAREVNANAYAQAVKNMAEGKGKGSGLTIDMRKQMEFNKWVRAPSDPLAVDPIVQALQKDFPEIKTKGDILANKAAKARAYQIFAGAGGGDSEDGDVTSPDMSPPGQTTATPAPQTSPSPLPAPRMYNNRQIHVDPAKRVWVYEDGTPVAQ